MLNPISRIAFALGALALLLAGAIWLKLARADERSMTKLLRRAALPTCAAMFLFAVGIGAMMWLGPWARPYAYSPELEPPYSSTD